jgi:hypothetical protein
MFAHENLNSYYNWYRVKDSKYVYLVSDFYQGISAERLFNFQMKR